MIPKIGDLYKNDWGLTHNITSVYYDCVDKKTLLVQVARHNMLFRAQDMIQDTDGTWVVKPEIE